MQNTVKGVELRFREERVTNSDGTGWFRAPLVVSRHGSQYSPTSLSSTHFSSTTLTGSQRPQECREFLRRNSIAVITLSVVEACVTNTSKAARVSNLANFLGRARELDTHNSNTALAHDPSRTRPCPTRERYSKIGQHCFVPAAAQGWTTAADGAEEHVVVAVTRTGASETSDGEYQYRSDPTR